jgi:geranylgeranyl diphosphate synthase type II
VTALEAYIAARRTEIDAALERCLPARAVNAPRVAEAMRYSLMAGGKRLRPMLVLASAETVADHVGESSADARRLAMPAACAIEMIHTYSLVHDDLPAMDDDELRRGRPTAHVVQGEGMAILAGDGLQAEAFGLLAREPDTSDPRLISRKLRVIALVAAAAGISGMVGGQAIDLDAVRPRLDRSADPMTAGQLEAMHAAKTGALIRAAAVAGALMGGGNRALVDAIDAYAREVGLAFQIVDDLLDIEGRSEALGKTAGKDVAAGKPTYPAFYGATRSREMAVACVGRAQDALVGVRLVNSTLGDLARWIVQRTS